MTHSVVFVPGAVATRVLMPLAYQTGAGCMLGGGEVQKIHVVSTTRACHVDVYDAYDLANSQPAFSTGRRRFEVDVTGATFVNGASDCHGSALTGITVTNLRKLARLYFPSGSPAQELLCLSALYGIVIVVTPVGGNLDAADSVTVTVDPTTTGRHRLKLAEKMQELASS